MSHPHPDHATSRTAGLWLQALQDLGPDLDDQTWYPRAHDIARSLRAAGDDEGTFVALINQALVLQQFLLEVACRSTRIGDRTTIVRQARRLLDPASNLEST